MKVDRRRLFKEFTIGSLTLASLPVFVDSFARPAGAEALRNFHFVAISVAGPAGTPKSPQHRVTMAGAGKFNPAKPGSEVGGGGIYAHALFPGRNPLPGERPLTIVAAGTWKAGTLVSYKEIGAWATESGGVLEMEIDLLQEIPSKGVTRGARLQLFCNIPATGLYTGHEEGFVLSIPGTDFAPGKKPGPFDSLVPPLGVTVFSHMPIPWPS